MLLLPPRVKRADYGAVVRADSNSSVQRCVSQEFDPSKHDRLTSVIRGCNARQRLGQLHQRARREPAACELECRRNCAWV